MRRLTRSLRRLPVTLALLVSAACGEPAWQGVSMQPAPAIPAFNFTLSSGETFSTAPVNGRPTFVFFGYTHCPDICPVTLSDWAKAKAQLGDDGQRVRWLFVSIDTERDTPAVAEAYAKQFDDAFLGLSGDSATVANIQAAFSVASYQTPGATDDDYLMGHASQSFLVDGDGTLRTMYSFNSGVDAMVTDLKRVLR